MKEYDFIDSESIISFYVDRDSDNLEVFLKGRYNVSSRLIRRLVREKLIFLNRERVRRNVSIRKGDIITLVMEDEEDSNLPDSDVELDIIYEDFDLLVLNKQPFTVVHMTKGHPIGTIANGVSDYFLKNNIKKSVRFINRLDRETSGVLLIGKNAFSHQQVSHQFKNNTVKKYYIAIVEGIVKDDFGTIDKPIERESEDSMLREVNPEGKRAITHYEVIKRYKEATLLKVRLETGRTHQIRVHLKYMGHPIIGDSLYNKESSLISRQALHSYSMEIYQPRREKRLYLVADLPKDIKRLIEVLEK